MNPNCKARTDRNKWSLRPIILKQLGTSNYRSGIYKWNGQSANMKAYDNLNAYFDKPGINLTDNIAFSQQYNNALHIPSPYRRLEQDTRSRPEQDKLDNARHHEIWCRRQVEYRCKSTVHQDKRSKPSCWRKKLIQPLLYHVCLPFAGYPRFQQPG